MVNGTIGNYTNYKGMQYTCSRNHHVAESETKSESKVAETIWPNVKLSPKLVTNLRLKLSFIIDPFFNYIIIILLTRLANRINHVTNI